MYSHLAKGITIGQLLTRLLLRSLLSIPGMVLDLFVALFWSPNYFDYWKDTQFTYAYGETVSGLQGVFGWLGELIGFVIGPFLGGCMALIIYFPQRLLQGLDLLYKQFTRLFNFVATDLAKRPLLKSYWVFDNIESHSWSKAMNISSLTLGTLTALPFWTIAKTLEFLFNAESNEVSKTVWDMTSWFGTALGFIFIAPCAAFIDYFVIKAEAIGNSLYQLGLKMSAFIYAKCHEEPLAKDSRLDDCFCTGETLHSQAFRDLFTHYKKTPTTDVIFGEQGQQHYPSPFAPITDASVKQHGEPSPPSSTIQHS